MKLINLPNLLTLLNLFSGCCAIVFAFNYQLDLVPYCVLLSLVADFFDGLAARFLKVSSDIGKELDSLADVVSFGVVPSVVVYQLLQQFYETKGSSPHELMIVAVPAFFIACFAALRLAKFNLDKRQSDGFIGLATPAATLFVVGLLLIVLNNSFGLALAVLNPYLLYTTIAALCFLMICELPMFAFKFRSYGWKGNEVRWLFIITSIVLLATLKFAAVALIIVLYVFVSLVLMVAKAKI